MDKKRNFRIILILLFIGFIISLVFAVKFFIDYREARETMAAGDENILELQHKLDSLSHKSYADELFIEGKYDSAMVAYQNIPGTRVDEEFIEKRMEIVDEMTAYRESLRRQVAQLEQQQDFSRNMSEIEINALKSRYERINDSLQQVMNNRITTIEGALEDKEQQLESQRLQKLVFQSARGTEISYFGEVRDGMANGTGVGIYATGSMYDGEWKNNKKHGVGVYKWVEGETYEGGFVDDKREGKGVYRWPNGNRFVGTWKNDQRDGHGILYDKDNNIVLEGIWKNDELVNSAN